MNTHEIGKKIKDIRKERKITQKQLAEKLGNAESTIRMWELGKNHPSPDSLKKISEILDYDYAELMHVAGYLDKKTTLEELTSDYVRFTKTIYELSVLIASNQDQLKKLHSLIEKEQIEEYENEFFHSQIKTHEKEIAMFKELLFDSISSKERTENEIRKEKEKINNEIEGIIKTLQI
ncbi:helix-turn-helix transcriptional regulator [Lysinibacillus sp. 1P01SD]|uniref:helix-turn-helix domain-containing protein n=1 Tax=Lysinibacillus sp. 1P01SD TaxID=3132285 RepID=UPI00399F5E68